jgi:dipeptidyl aminopeptidase/acylaminoacyl peptidase
MAQYYADNGYVVMYPNVRGSTGYGAEFRDACLKDWGGKDLEDWAAGRQYLIDNYSADPDRIAITGGSYGGYATLISVGRKPDLWKLGAAIVPISNLQSLYADDLPHFKYYLRQQMGDPVKDKELWEERSPITYADSVTAKMLLLHGENDPRCPVAESRNYVEALKNAGKVEGEDFEYVEIKGQGHGMFTDRAARIRDATIVSEYIMRHL